MKTVMRLCLGVACVAVGCGPDDSAVESAGTDAIAGTTDGTTAAEAGMTGSTNGPTGADGSGSDTTSTGEGTGSTTDGVTSTSAESGSGASTGQAPGAAYDPCEADEQCDPELRCSQVTGYCTPDCDIDAMDCPPPRQGDSIQSCAETSNGSLCRLHCSVGTTICPDGMACNARFPGPPPSCEYP